MLVVRRLRLANWPANQFHTNGSNAISGTERVQILQLYGRIIIAQHIHPQKARGGAAGSPRNRRRWSAALPRVRLNRRDHAYLVVHG